MFYSLIKKIARSRSKVVVARVTHYIKKSNKIVDIGSGSGDVALLLQTQGYNVTPVDVADFHGPRLIKTVLYDGKRLPFPDKSFDTAFLLMVLHHTPDPELVLSEAVRVAKEIILIETSYASAFNKINTVIIDAIANLRLSWFWNSYKTDKEWRKLFAELKLKVVKTYRFYDKYMGFPFLHVSYYLKKF